MLLNPPHHGTNQRTEAAESGARGLVRAFPYLRTSLAPLRLQCDIHIYKNGSNAVRGLLEDEVNLAQFSPATYVQARAEVRSTDAPWVATTNLSPVLLKAIQQSLLSLSDPSILPWLSPGLTGFAPATAANYDELERQMERQCL